MSLIDSFLHRYAKEYDYYYELARQVASICETLLHRNGIRAIVTYRAKKPDSLRDKLNKRHEMKSYKSIEQIYKDIVDLAGVRIATYFPGDREEIGKLIESEFITKKVKLFPNNDHKNPFHFDYKKRFAGYDAMHFRVNIREDNLSDNLKRYSQAQVEIQIASSLMHAWAEVEHDMAYKPKIGSLSEDEFKILDELNGLVLSGEIALERLQRAFKHRISAIDHQFNNHYELAALIREKVKIQQGSDVYMGRVDILLRFLQKLQMDNPTKLCPYLKKLSLYDCQKTIVNKLVDLILSDYPTKYLQFIEAKFEVRTHNPYSVIEKQMFTYNEHKNLEEYIKNWIVLEKVMNYIMKKNMQNGLSESFDLETRLKNMFGTMESSDDMVHDTKYLCTLRNQILYGNELPDNDVLNSANSTLVKLREQLKMCSDQEVRALINE